MNKYKASDLSKDPEFVDYRDVITVLFGDEVITKEEARIRIKRFLSMEVD